VKGSPGRRLQHGQAVVETVVVISVFGVFLLGILQAILFYRVKTTVDYAALQAARSGATHFAEMSAMRVGLARGLMPLYAHKASKTEVTRAYGEALLMAHNPLVTQIKLISPTKAAFADWKAREFDGVEAIPNDSLMFRSKSPGKSSGLTIQDANVLKIRVVYGYKMIVPVIDKIVIAIFREGLYQGMSAQEIAMLESGRLPIVSQAVVRMQTPIRDRDLLASTTGAGDGDSGDGPPGGGSDPGDGGGDTNPGDGDPGGGGENPPSGGNHGGGDPPDHVCI